MASAFTFFLLYIAPMLFNLYTEYIMRNAGLDEEQAGIEIARRNINNLRYADDITLMPFQYSCLENPMDGRAW